jgi:hypothetical protein
MKFFNLLTLLHLRPPSRQRQEADPLELGYSVAWNLELVLRPTVAFRPIQSKSDLFRLKKNYENSRPNWKLEPGTFLELGTWDLKLSSGDPNGIRTRVTAVKGRCPRPLDDRVVKKGLANICGKLRLSRIFPEFCALVTQKGLSQRFCRIEARSPNSCAMLGDNTKNQRSNHHE